MTAATAFTAATAAATAPAAPAAARVRRWYAAPALAAVFAAFIVAAPQAARASNLDFEIINRTNQPIVGFWASPVSSTTWGERFDNTFVPEAGGRQQVRFNDTRSGCHYGVRVQFAEGAVRYWESLNLCTMRGMQIYVSNGEVKASTW